jgi:S-adenosylmethionine:tRNA ribosyltransferase-isomerase
MKVTDFDFVLPDGRIALRPARPRDAARLLVVGETLSNRSVRELPVLLRPGDLLVFNDTRVLAARLRGLRGKVKIEATLLKPVRGGQWFALARPAKRLRPGNRIDFGSGVVAEVVARGEGGAVTLDFACDDRAVTAALERIGEMPLPPYIARTRVADAQDLNDYQTVYARAAGAVAAPTAGLHFTPELMAALEAAGISAAMVTLHVGAGTFLPVKSERTEDHVMHAESGEISEAAATQINQARAAGGRIVAVGTTSLRLLESAADEGGNARPFVGETNLYITPGYVFQAVDLLMTNFHLPRSTLFMLVCAFAGTARMKSAYAHAIENNYRFYSYGDTCLLGCAPS